MKHFDQGLCGCDKCSGEPLVINDTNIRQIISNIRDDMDPMKYAYKRALKVPFKIVEPLQLPYPQPAKDGLTGNVQ